MHAAVLDEHDVAGLPLDATAVMDVVAAPFEHVEAGAVEMAVLLAVGAGRVDLDVGFDRLGDGRVLRTDDVLAVLPGHLSTARRAKSRPGSLDQLLVEMAVGAFERAHEGALLGQRSISVLELFLAFRRLVVADARRLLVEAVIAEAPLMRSHPYGS